MKGRQHNRPAYGKLIILVILISVAFFLSAQTWPSVSDTIGYVYAGRQLANEYGLKYIGQNKQGGGPCFSLYAFQIRIPDNPHIFQGLPPRSPILLTDSKTLIDQAQVVHCVVPLLAIVGLLALGVAVIPVLNQLYYGGILFPSYALLAGEIAPRGNQHVT